MHGVHDVGRRIDALDLYTDHTDAPLICGIVQYLTESAVHTLAGREGLIQGHLADDIAKVGLGQLGDRQLEVGDVVEQALGIGGLEIDHGVHRRGYVVLCDDLLRRHVNHLLPHVDGPQPIDERNDDAQARRHCLFEFAETLNHALLVGLNDPDSHGDGDHGREDQDDENA